MFSTGRCVYTYVSGHTAEIKNNIKMNKINILAILLLAISISCNKDESPEPQQLTKETLSGFVQKGPFINGTSITVSELDASLVQTGNTFNTQIVENSGTFELKDITLSSPFVQLQADGFYFDEVVGEKSSAQLTLFALSDISVKDQINVNILTHLEKGRVEFLIGEDVEFNQAKDSAQHELLLAFGIDNPNIENSEELDISVNNSGNATLIAISIILQANNSVADLTELLANINTDFRQDGILNSEKIKSELFNTTQNLNLEEIRTNLENRYSELGLSADIADFESVIEQYLASQKPFNINAEVSNVTCNGLNNGSINITVNEGTEPFSYEWSNGASTEDIGNLAPGSYSVTITDANDYVLHKNDIIISEPVVLEASSSVNHVTSIDGSDGSVTLSVSGGTEPFTYEWSNSETTDNLQNLEKGFYSVTILDSNSCSTQLEMAVQEPVELSIEKTDVNCFGDNQGTINLSILGGLEPYSIQWSNGSQSTELTNLAANTYSVTVTDVLGYIVEESIEITQPNELNIEYELTNPTPGNKDGEIILTTSGGTAPFIYSWSNGATSESSGSIGSGEFTVTVTDANLCIAELDLTVYGAFVDSRDDREYSTIKIGEQVWMAENLNATLYNDQTSIQFVGNSSSWESLTTGAYTWPGTNGSNESYRDTYGILYNWYAVSTGKLCPQGWHVPSDSEWTILSDYLGGDSEAGGKLKEVGTSKWNSPNSGANNDSKFSAVPSGYRFRYGVSEKIGDGAFFWSTSEVDAGNAYYRYLWYNQNKITRTSYFKQQGYCVRCIQD